MNPWAVVRQPADPGAAEPGQRHGPVRLDGLAMRDDEAAGSGSQRDAACCITMPRSARRFQICEAMRGPNASSGVRSGVTRISPTWRRLARAYSPAMNASS